MYTRNEVDVLTKHIMHMRQRLSIPGARNKSEQYLEDDQKHTYIKKTEREFSLEKQRNRQAISGISSEETRLLVYMDR